MANPSQRLPASLPCALDQTAKQVEDLVVHLQKHHEASWAEGTPLDERSRDGTSAGPTQTADDASNIVTDLFMRLLDIPAYRTPIENALRHDRLRSALLNLLVYMVRWEHPTQQAAHQITADATKEQSQRQVTTEEDNNQPRIATSGGSVVRCRFFLLAILADMLGKGAEDLTEQRGGAGSGVAQGAGSRRRAESLAPDRPTLSLLALELGCALLRMHTLQCCSRQVAAVCAQAGVGVHEQEGEGEQVQQQEQQQRQRQLPGHRRKQEGEQQRAGAEQGMGYNWRRNASDYLGVVQSSLGLVDGLLALADAAVEVVSSDAEPPPAGPGAMAMAAAAQHADCRRLSRRFLLLLACSLRDSHLLEHCARAVVVAAVGRRRCGTSSSACGEAVEGQGLAGGSTDSSLDALRGVIRDVSWTEDGARRLLSSCEHAPAPVRAVVGPAVRQALTGTTMAHLALALGLRALCTADGGPEYGMPVSYRALPVEWDMRKPREGLVLYSAQHHLVALAEAFGRPELMNQLLGLLGSEGPMLTLLLRVCELATRSAQAHGQRDEEVEEGDEREGDRGRGGRGRQGSSAPGGLRHVLAPYASLQIGLRAFKIAGALLEECWEHLQMDAGGEIGRGDHRLGAGTVDGNAGLRDAGADGEDAEGSDGPSTQAHGAVGAGGGAPEAAWAGSGAGFGGGRSEEKLDATTEGVLEGASGPHSPAAEAVAAASQAGGPPRRGQPAPAPAARRSRLLPAAALLAFEVRWWRCVRGAAEHMVPPLRMQPEQRETQEAAAHNVAELVQPGQLDLSDPCEGPLPPAPPPRLAAALDGGLLPCLEGVLRRAARDPAGTTGRFACEVLALANKSVRQSAGFLWLLAFGEVDQGLAFLNALCRLLPMQPRCSSGGGCGDRWRPGPKEAGMRLLPQAAVDTASMAVNRGMLLWSRQADAPKVDSSGGDGGGASTSSGGNGGGGSDGSRLAARQHVPPPPGLPRLQLLLLHAVRLLLPPLARLVQGHAGDAEQQEQEPTRQWRLTAGVLAPVLTWLPALCLASMRGGRGEGPGSGCGSGTGDRGGDGDGDGVGGSTHTSDQQQQGAPQPRDCALRRFLFAELGAVELLGAVLRHLHALPFYAARDLTVARALCMLAAAFPHDVRRRCTAADWSQVGSASNSSAKRGAKGRRDRGASGVGPGLGAASQVGSVWPVALVRALGAEMEVLEVEGLAAAVEALAALLEAWGGGRGVQGEEDALGGELSRLRTAVGQLPDVGDEPRSMGRVLLEVLSEFMPLPACQALGTSCASGPCAVE